MIALVIGFGSAGRRLGRGLDALGVDKIAVDPAMTHLSSVVCFDTIEKALEWRGYDFAIIATPPSLHLSQIHQCLEAGLPVLCEKPLCVWGQLSEAEKLLSHPMAGKVGLCFNYRYHPTILDLKQQNSAKWDEKRLWSALSAQNRVTVPEWGLILDHLPHTIDLMLWLSGAVDMVVERASCRDTEWLKVVYAAGKLNGAIPWNISDSVHAEPIKKVGWLDGPFGMTPIETPPETVELMTRQMLAAWIEYVKFGGNFPGLEEGLAVQRVLEQIKDKTERS